MDWTIMRTSNRTIINFKEVYNNPAPKVLLGILKLRIGTVSFPGGAVRFSFRWPNKLYHQYYTVFSSLGFRGPGALADSLIGLKRPELLWRFRFFFLFFFLLHYFRPVNTRFLFSSIFVVKNITCRCLIFIWK